MNYLIREISEFIIVIPLAIIILSVYFLYIRLQMVYHLLQY